MSAKRSENIRRVSTETRLCDLEDLHFDLDNPRFGDSAHQFKKEEHLLDYIAENFEIEDVLSSIAANGFFQSEPLIGIDLGGRKGIKIVEGNRRLAACLILANDPRARNQEKRHRHFAALQERVGRDPFSQIPITIFSDESPELLSYLGVRHIAGNKPWDSYAKAAWIASVLDEGKLTLEEVTEMIGDRHRTIARMLEGYYFVNQLINKARFVPANSMRSGRGSNTAYPFSWVYTALGFGPVREYLGIADKADGLSKKPVPTPKLDNAQTFMQLLFGNKSKAVDPAVLDSRDIPELAVCLGDTARMRLLAKGKNVREVKELSRPAKERVALNLLEAIDLLGQSLQLITEGEITSEEVDELLKSGKRAQKLAAAVNDELAKLRRGEADDE